jgi:hypothetical protein
MFSRHLMTATIGFAFFLSAQAFAAKVYEVAGTVVKMDQQTLSVRNADEVYEFDRHSIQSEIPAGLKVGDHVTISYTLHPQHLSAEPKQEAGQSGETVPGEIDDRAFYSAQR